MQKCSEMCEIMQKNLFYKVNKLQISSSGIRYTKIKYIYIEIQISTYKIFCEAENFFCRHNFLHFTKQESMKYS